MVKTARNARIEMHRRFSSRLVPSVAVHIALALSWTLLLLTVNQVAGEEECMHKTIQCYTCDSMYDPRCHDPFNFTNLPDVEECLGCCVKLVTNVGTEIEVTRRLCTKKLSINLFMVDHVCMREGDRTGHMCFCEDDLCNGATGPGGSGSVAFLIVSTALSGFLAVREGVLGLLTARLLG